MTNHIEETGGWIKSRPAMLLRLFLMGAAMTLPLVSSCHHSTTKSIKNLNFDATVLKLSQDGKQILVKRTDGDEAWIDLLDGNGITEYLSGTDVSVTKGTCVSVLYYMGLPVLSVQINSGSEIELGACKVVPVPSVRP